MEVALTVRPRKYTGDEDEVLLYVEEIGGIKRLFTAKSPQVVNLK